LRYTYHNEKVSMVRIYLYLAHGNDVAGPSRLFCYAYLESAHKIT